MCPVILQRRDQWRLYGWVERFIEVSSQQFGINLWHVAPAFEECCGIELKSAQRTKFGHWLAGPRDNHRLTCSNAIDNLAAAAT